MTNEEFLRQFVAKPRGEREREEYEKAGIEKTREIQPERKPLS